jgi:hypothetical protein
MKKTLSFFFSFYLFLSASFSQIIINEVHFNPASSQGSDWNYEFFEIFNAGQSAVDLAGYSLNDYSTSSLQATYTFPTMSIEAGGYGIVSVDTAQATGYVAYKNLTVPIWRINDVSQTTDFNMGNSGGKISIYNGATLVDSVNFEAANGVSDIDGGGKSWELKDFALDNSVSSNWAASTADGGSPGAVNGNFSGTPWSSGGGGTAGGSGPVRTHAAGTWTGDTAPMINSLNAASTDTNYWQYFDWGVAGLSATSDSMPGHYEVNQNSVKDSGFVNVSYSTDVKNEGTGSMKLDVSVHGTEGWGGYAKIQHMHPDTANGFYDFSKYDTISFQYYMPEAASQDQVLELRFNVIEYSNVTDPTYIPVDGDGGKTLGEYYYSFTAPRLGAAMTGWATVDIPLVEDPNNWDNKNGFNRTGWAGISGNTTFDTDRIKGFAFEFSGNATDRSVTTATVYIDNITLKGRKTTPYVYFNGKASPADMGSPFGWGDGSASTLEVVSGAGTSSETNALKWTMGGDGWGVTGAGWNINPTHDMSYEWMKDTIQFKYKTAKFSGDNIRLQYEAGSGKLVKEVDITADDKWHTVKVALQDFVYGDNTTSGFDTTKVKVFQFIAQGKGYAGETMMITEAWTGNPSFDFVSPAVAENVDAIPGTYTNAVVWDDVPGEFGEVYDVYASRTPFTTNSPDSLQAADVVALGVAEGTQEAYHDITVPLADRPASWYYAVVATDAAGNKSKVAGMTSSVDNIARGIPTISLTPPSGFKADGDISEWLSSGIHPLEMGVSSNSMGTPNVWATVDSDDDAYVKLYIAADAEKLYIAADVTDDAFNVGAGNWWEQDAMEVFMGLYDQRGPKHAGAGRGAEPDYKFAFLGDSAFVEFGTSTGLSDKSYVEYANSGVNGSPNAVIEFSIRLDSLAKINTDSVFVAKEGMRIPIEPAWHDNDGSGWEGNLFMSKNNTDNAWQTPSVWSHTYVGRYDGDILSTQDDIVASSFELKRNYPNPFNPSTTIEYSLGLAGPTKLMIYDVLGRELVTLVDEYRPAGVHKVMWNASGLPSGVYFYRLESSDFNRTQKMILMK